MVGRNQQAVITLGLQCGVQWADNMSVNFFQRFDFGRAVSFMRCFVGGFHMHADNIYIGQCFNGILPLGCVIRIGVARGSRHFNAFPAHQSGQPAQ